MPTLYPCQHSQNTGHCKASNVLVTPSEGGGNCLHLRLEPIQHTTNGSIGSWKIQALSSEGSNRLFHIKAETGSFLAKRIVKPLGFDAFNFLHIFLLPHMCDIGSLQIIEVTAQASIVSFQCILWRSTSTTLAFVAVSSACNWTFIASSSET
jgi:hypothetical protein